VLDDSGQALAITNPIYGNYQMNEVFGIWDGAE